MSFAIPAALLLFAASIGMALLVLWRAPLIVSRLPGAWARVVEQPLRSYLARISPAGDNGQLALCLAIALVLSLALSRPLVDRDDTQDFANLTGRVLVFDVGAGAGIARQRLAAKALLDAQPQTPTAVVAVAGDAYTVVPLTTDRRQIERYLNVLAPDVMPGRGRALHRGIAFADKVLREAGVGSGQTVLLSSGSAPRAIRLPQSQHMRAIVVPEADIANWRDLATLYGARLVSPANPKALVDDLADAARQQRRTRMQGGVFDLTPWLVGLALIAWLGLFRRRADL